MLTTVEILASLPRQDFECHERVLHDLIADHMGDIEDNYSSPSTIRTAAPVRRCNGQNGPVGLLVYEARERGVSRLAA